jgi:hypothetical protein
MLNNMNTMLRNMNTMLRNMNSLLRRCENHSRTYILCTLHKTKQRAV